MFGSKHTSGSSSELPENDSVSTSSVPVDLSHKRLADTTGTSSFSSLPTFLSRPRLASNPPTINSEAGDLLRSLGLPGASTDTLEPLPRLEGYVLEGRLGRGGMGVVYQAIDTQLKRTVAVKMIRSDLANPVELARFEAEAVAVAAIRHRNVIQVFDSGRHGNDPYFVMEYLSGGSLAERLKTQRLDPFAAADLVERLAEGVHASHSRGVVHRDIKPANVLFDEHDEPKLSDFGLAKQIDSTITHAEALLGTPAYMAPEQASGNAKFVGPAADVYSLGVILFECLTGRRPFIHENNFTLLQRVQTDPPPSPSDSVADLPYDLELICLKCLEKSPGDRYATAEALAEDLARFRRGEPVTVRRRSPLVRACRWAQRDPMAAGFVAFAVVVLLTAVMGVMQHESRIDAEHALAADAERRERDEQHARIAAESLAEARRRLAEEAEQSKARAEGLAKNQALLSLVDRVGRQLVSRTPGWTWEIEAQLANSAALLAGSPMTLRSLRSVLAGNALNADVRLKGIVVRNVVPGAIAACPAAKTLAVAEKRTISLLTPCLIQILDSDNGTVLRDLEVATGFIRNKKLLEVDSVRSLVFTKDGSRLFVGTQAGWIYRFTLVGTDSKPDRSWNTTGPIRHMEVSPDDQRLYACCSDESRLQAFDMDGRPIPFLQEAAAANTFTVHPRSGDIFYSDNNLSGRIDAETLSVNSDYASRLRNKAADFQFSPDGRFLFAAFGETVHTLDPETLVLHGSFLDPNLRKASHEGFVGHIAVSPSGEYLATACLHFDRTVKIWQTGTERLVGSITVPGTQPIRLAWSSNSRWLYATSINETLRFEVRTPDAQQIVAQQLEPVERATFTQDGKGFVTLGGFSIQSNLPRRIVVRGLIEASDHSQQIRVSSARQVPFGLSVQPGSENVIVATQSTGIRIWKPSGELVQIAASSNPMQLPTYDFTGQSILAVLDHTKVACWETDLARHRAHLVWDARPAKSLRMPFTLDALAVGRDRVVAGSSDGTIYVLALQDLTKLAELGHTGEAITQAAIRPDDAIAVVGNQTGAIVFVDLGAGTASRTVQAHTGPITALAFSRDGQYLATASKARSIRVWRQIDGKYETVLTLESLPAGVRDLRFSPVDDRLMVVLDQERAVRIWDLARIREHLDANQMAW